MDLLLIGLTLFSMFFGAGNLIFPPFLGAQAGVHTWIAMAGFAATAICFPILGVIAVARSGGLDKLAGRAGKRFASVFTLLAYLSTGPCLAIPRTASTSFEMAVIPFVGSGVPLGRYQFLYSCVFFGIALLLALRPDKLSDRLGKILTPCLLSLILIVFIGCVLKPSGHYTAPVPAYSDAPFVKGFLEGYLTMDTIAALNFGIIIALNIRARGITGDEAVVQETMKAGVIAGVILALVYAALAHIGAMTGGTFELAENGARTLNQVVGYEFGSAGTIILAVIFFIACLNTCVGLISCCSKYFCTIFPGVGYRAWAVVFAVISLVISNAGLNRILEISVPVLNAIYPVAIVLIILSLLDRFWEERDIVYPAAVLITGVVSVSSALLQAGIQIPLLAGMVRRLPFYRFGLEWIVPAAAAVLVSALLPLNRMKDK